MAMQMMNTAPGRNESMPSDAPDSPAGEDSAAEKEMTFVVLEVSSDGSVKVISEAGDDTFGSMDEAIPAIRRAAGADAAEDEKEAAWNAMAAERPPVDEGY